MEQSRFEQVADRVSWAIGTPTNIAIWLAAVAAWFFVGAAFPDWWTHGSFLPAWFTSTAWNFPLNTVTTLAQLYIGFLIAAAANRAERNHAEQLRAIREMTEAIHGHFLVDHHDHVTETTT